MTLPKLLALIFTVAALCSWLNHRFLKLPSAIGVMSISVVLSLAIIALAQTNLADVSFAYAAAGLIDFQSMLLHGMLAFLLFAGALSVNLDELIAERGAVAVFATIGVILATVLTGGLFWLGLKGLGIDVPLVIALLFGAIVAPTDAVAVLGILRKVGVPKALETKVVGESLFNDGVGVVVFFTLLSVAFGGDISFIHFASEVFLDVVGGLALGGILGWIVHLMLKGTEDYVVGILLTLALASGGYTLAELLHLSAPICVVSAGLIIATKGRESVLSEHTREHIDTFWEIIDSILNVVLFVLIGIKMITLSIDEHYVLAGLLGVGAMLLSRFASIWIPVSVMKHFRPFSPHVVKILSWGGLKGGISVALALAVPTGEYQDLLVISAYVVVLFSVLVQGSTLSVLLMWTKRRTTQLS